ncbi:MazG nucleotide pyrophosphohydrolase domain protein [compost metagenome]
MMVQLPSSWIQKIRITFNFLLKKMTIKEAQEVIDKWINSTGVRYFNELTNTAILMEEVGEVARIMARQYGEQSFKKSDKEVNLADEMADVLFVLMCLANQTGIDLTEALEQNLQKKSIRDADRHKNNEKLK